MENAVLWDVAKLVLVFMAVKVFAPSLFTAFNDFIGQLKKTLTG